jgi:G3E family GTPase
MTVPVCVVTGFLGSGKTTLIARLLRDPALARTAVIVNEFGDIALDHDLIAASDDKVLTLNTGCLCCAVLTDLAATLLELRATRAGDYDRVVIETSGLSDPVPLLQAMMSDAAVAETHRMPFVVTVVDTVHGTVTLRDHHEARNQVALADLLLLSKTDVAPAGDALLETVAALNQTAPLLPVGDAGAGALFGETSAADRLGAVERRPAHADAETVSIERDRPLPALALPMWMQALSEHCGERLLRLKGLVEVAEMPGRPAVVHAVRHVVAEPEFLDAWPGDGRRTRIVLIMRGVPRYFPARLLDAIEEEVRDASA